MYTACRCLCQSVYIYGGSNFVHSSEVRWIVKFSIGITELIREGGWVEESSKCPKFSIIVSLVRLIHIIR
jgi:hypothetical protein